MPNREGSIKENQESSISMNEKLLEFKAEIIRIHNTYGIPFWTTEDFIYDWVIEKGLNEELLKDLEKFASCE